MISIKWGFRQMGIPAFLGISLHSLLDGIALGAGLFCRSWVRSYFSQLWFTRCLTVCPFLRFCWPQEKLGFTISNKAPVTCLFGFHAGTIRLVPAFICFAIYDTHYLC